MRYYCVIVPAIDAPFLLIIPSYCVVSVSLVIGRPTKGSYPGQILS